MPFSDTHKLWPHTHINHVCNTCYHGNGNSDAFLSNSTTLHSNQLQTPHSNRAAIQWVPWHFGCATRPSSAVRLNVTAKEGLCGLNVKLLVDSTTDENVQHNPSWNCLGVVKINVPLIVTRYSEMIVCIGPLQRILANTTGTRVWPNGWWNGAIDWCNLQHTWWTNNNFTKTLMTCYFLSTSRECLITHTTSTHTTLNAYTWLYTHIAYVTSVNLSSQCEG